MFFILSWVVWLHFETGGSRAAFNRVSFILSAHHPKHHGSHADESKNSYEPNRRQRDQDDFNQLIVHGITQTALLYVDAKRYDVR